MTAVILMTHNYEADLEILRGLKDARLGYLGCLGTAARFRRLKEDLLNFHQEQISTTVEGVVAAPAGIFAHSRSPNEIALSIIAQIQDRIVQSRDVRAVDHPVELHQLRPWTLILAAGASARFGGPKAVAKWGEDTLLSRARKTAEIVSDQRVMVVTGGHADVIEPLLTGTHWIFNDRWQQGMGTSIAAGIQRICKIDPSVALIFIVPVDQPFVTADHLIQLASAAANSQRCALTTDQDGVIGSPAAVPRTLFAQATALQGDRGLKSILRPDQWICVESAKAMLDVDEPADLQKFVEF